LSFVQSSKFEEPTHFVATGTIVDFNTWLSHTWWFMTEYNIRIEMSTPEIPLLRESDQLLMTTFFHAGICSKELATLNQCCIYLWVNMLANISDGSGFYIANSMLVGQPNTTFTSGFTWPNQGQPTKKEWAQWHHGLQLAIAVD